MRYYDDGDLTDGIKLAETPLGAEFLAGDYHVVWTFCNGKRATLDWTTDIALAEWDFTFRPSDSSHPPTNFNVHLHFGSLDLEYTLEYTSKSVNNLKLVHNNAPGEGHVDSEAVLTFSDLRDEQGFPYLRCNFATNEHAPEDDMVNIEFVAKRTDTEGIRQLGLTKNEKLRLGYAVWDDGTFEPEDEDEELNNQNPDSLNKQLQRHIEASVKIHAKLVTIQNNINKQVTNATNGMQQAMQQAWRSVSTHPGVNLTPSFERDGGEGPSPPASKRRKGNAVAGASIGGVEGGSDGLVGGSPGARRKAGPESTPLSMELEEGDVHAGHKRRRGENFIRGGRGGKRKSGRKST